ncbi:MAG: hypothetical protein WBN83_17260 [Desulfoprunum sp.]|uniref:glutaredoxin family protein n=1 Tax=Desulfoprunum sp. TaxID=2020866 RepID=UPI003C713BA1
MADKKFLAVPGWLKDFFADPFQRWLCLGLVVLGLVISFQEYRGRQQPPTAGGRQISFFFHPQCPHCREEKKFIPYMQAKYPEIVWASYDTSRPENRKLLASLAAKSGYPARQLGVPMTFIGPYVISGYKSAETTGVRIEKAIRAYLHDDPSLYPEAERTSRARESLDLPFVGEIRLADYSLPALAIIIGLVDGFNPCAMWVLVYLISLIVSINDRRKVWLLVGTFVLSSGVLYFLFMTAWLNVFLLMGYLHTLTLVIGLAALGAGVISVREFIRTRGQLVCKIGDVESKKRTMGRIERIVNSPLTWFSVISIIALAFIVNSIEFACSAALPAIFTHTLSLRNLPTLEYYGYILLYDLFFMLDDLAIFSLAVLALDTTVGTRYAGYCKIIGGTVLIGLGAVMVFWPELLR